MTRQSTASVDRVREGTTGRAEAWLRPSRRAVWLRAAAWLTLGAMAGPASAQLSSADIAALRQRSQAESSDHSRAGLHFVWLFCRH